MGKRVKSKRYSMVYIHEHDGWPTIFYGDATGIREIVKRYDLDYSSYAIFEGSCLKSFDNHWNVRKSEKS